MSLARFAFQACALNHSAISPLIINDLQSCLDRGHGNCDKSSNERQSLTGFLSIAAARTGVDGRRRFLRGYEPYDGVQTLSRSYRPAVREDCFDSNAVSQSSDE